MATTKSPDGRVLDVTGDESGTEKVEKEKGSTDIRAKKALTGKNRNYTNLEQQILIQNLDKAAAYHTSHPELFGYRTFRQVKGDSVNLIGNLKGLPDLNIFRNMKTSTLSLLQPKIRIFSVSYEEFQPGPGGSIDEGHHIALPAPCYREFKFSDNFGFELASTVEDYLAYESTKPTFRNIGLKSFSLKWDGRKHGRADTDIMCTLEISLKSLKDLNASPPGEPHHSRGGLRYVDLVTFKGSKKDSQEQLYSPKENTIKVLMGYSAPSEAQLQGLNLSTQEIADIKRIARFNMMLSLGMVNYSIKILEDGRVSMSINYRTRIERTMGGNSVNIFQNSYEVSKDGELVPSTRTDIKQNIGKIYNYNTTINSIFKQLSQDNCKDEKCKARPQLRALITKDRFFSNIYNEALGVGIKKDPKTGSYEIKNEEEVYRWMKNPDNIKRILALIRQKVGLFKKNIFKSFTDALIDGNPLENGGAGSRLFCVNAHRDDIKKALGIVEEEAEKKDKKKLAEEDIIKATSAAIGHGPAGIKIGRCNDIQEDSVRVKEETANQLSTDLTSESKSKDKAEKKEKKSDGSEKPIFDFSSEKYKFYYLYLGDIIELACRNAGLKVLDFDTQFMNEFDTPFVFSRGGYIHKTESEIDYPLGNIRILLGPMEYYNSRKKIKQINLAQFPISFNFFRAWFVKNVVSRRNSQMPLRDFIIRLMKEVVITGMGFGMTESVKSPLTEFKAELLTLPGKQKKGQKFRAFGREVVQPEELLPVEPLLDVTGPSFELNYHRKVREIVSLESMVRTSYDYLLLYFSSGSDITRRRGDPIQDMKDGIFHFNVGSDYGMLKSMNFSKVNMPFRIEQMYEESVANGADNAKQLSFPFNTDITLVGTPCFTPGMFYYVNPSLLGLGSIEDRNSIAHQLNLGGYHLVLVCEMTISKDGFETKLTGKQQGHGTR